MRVRRNNFESNESLQTAIFYTSLLTSIAKATQLKTAAATTAATAAQLPSVNWRFYYYEYDMENS